MVGRWSPEGRAEGQPAGWGHCPLPSPSLWIAEAKSELREPRTGGALA